MIPELNSKAISMYLKMKCSETEENGSVTFCLTADFLFGSER